MNGPIRLNYLPAIMQWPHGYSRIPNVVKCGFDKAVRPSLPWSAEGMCRSFTLHVLTFVQIMALVITAIGCVTATIFMVFIHEHGDVELPKRKWYSWFTKPSFYMVSNGSRYLPTSYNKYFNLCVKQLQILYYLLSVYKA